MKRVLLLASFMPAALRRANSARSATAAPTVTHAPGSRPVSYVTSEEDEQVRSDAERARQLEMSLARLEEGGQPAAR